MSERERWIVYPLLFLALGAALRDKLFDRTTSRSIVCQELTVVDADPAGNRQVQVLARIGRSDPTVGTPSSGYLIVNGQVDVQGVVNAQQYRYQGMPFVPALQGVPLGVSWADVLRAIQQSAANAPQPPAAPTKPPQAGSLPSERSPSPPADSRQRLAEPRENQ
jgi:hypothetical protein